MFARVEFQVFTHVDLHLCTRVITRVFTWIYIFERIKFHVCTHVDLQFGKRGLSFSPIELQFCYMGFYSHAEIYVCAPRYVFLRSWNYMFVHLNLYFRARVRLKQFNYPICI